MYPGLSKDFRSAFKEYLRIKVVNVARICCIWRDIAKEGTQDTEAAPNVDPTITATQTNGPTTLTDLAEIPSSQNASSLEIQFLAFLENENSCQISTKVSSSISSPAAFAHKTDYNNSYLSEAPQNMDTATGDGLSEIIRHKSESSVNITTYNHKQRAHIYDNETNEVKQKWKSAYHQALSVSAVKGVYIKSVCILVVFIGHKTYI